jgi:putative transposase
MSAPDLCRKHGISDATFYTWRRKYRGLEVADEICAEVGDA